jgi:uncharacterized protein YfaA (DUF2138 family)
MRKSVIYILFFWLLGLGASAQELFYSPAESGVDNLLKYEAVGRVGKHILIYRELKGQHFISVFANNMSLVRKVELSILPKDVLAVDFMNTGSKANLIFQYLINNKLFMAYTSIDEDGKVTSDPILLDSAFIENIAEFPLFEVVVNPTKTMFMHIYLQTTNDLLTRMSTALYDSKIQKVEQATLLVSTPDGVDKLNQFKLDYEGNLVFLRNALGDESIVLSRSDILVKPKGVDEVKNATIQFNKIGIKDLKIAIDYKNSRVLAASIFNGGSIC